ncbi:MAG: tripartite tricarboxylate transporter substrate binding protein [Betaproteobacteria bacterium]|nr:tripartite tricarboxylate transporter substrate binding protein [Betaproteobacteria bacterium]
MFTIRRIAALALAMSCTTLAAGQVAPFPVKPIRMVVPFPPGGTTDILARVLGQKMADNWGKTVVVDNRSGGSGVIAAEIVAKATPDGHTVFAGTTSEMATNPSLFRKLPYSVEKDFAPVALAATAPLVLVAHPSLPARSVRELIDLARARPGTLSYASVSNGSPQHLSGEMLKRLSGIEIVHVPYRGGGPATTALLGGHEVKFGFVATAPVMPHVRAGKLRALAVSTAKRSRAAPDVPTLQEAGVKDFDTSVWFAFFVPAGTPQHVIGALHAEITRILKLPDVTERLTGLGLEITLSSPEALTRFVRLETLKYRRIIEASGTRLD